MNKNIKKIFFLVIILIVLCPSIVFVARRQRIISRIENMVSQQSRNLDQKVGLLIFYNIIRDQEKVIKFGEEIIPQLKSARYDLRYLTATIVGKTYRNKKFYQKELALYDFLLADREEHLHMLRSESFAAQNLRENQIEELKSILALNVSDQIKIGVVKDLSRLETMRKTAAVPATTA